MAIERQIPPAGDDLAALCIKNYLPAHALAMEVQRFRQIYNTIRPHQAIGDRVPRDAYLAGS